MEELTDGTASPVPWFLQTVPQPRSGSIRRPRLLSLLDERLDAAPMVIVAAPSGFGKTVAVADWAREREGTHWFSAVASADNEALLGAILRRERDAPQQGPVTLVVDDAHLVSAAELSSSIASDAALRSGLVRLVLIGQPELVDAYARPRAMGLASVITTAALSFSPEDIDALLQARGLAASSDSAGLLESTGGWPIAVQLQLLSHTRVQDGAAPEAHESPAATTPDLADYVEHVLLPAVPPALADFLLTATTCSRLDAQLARDVTGAADAEELLEQCRRSGLFLDAHTSGHAETVYRWHDVFAAQCRRILGRTDADRARRCNTAAARRLSARYPTEAAAHALRAEDAELAGEILRKNWLGLLLSGQTRALEALCLELPALLRNSGVFLAIRACCRDLAGDEAGARMLRERLATLGETTTVPSFTHAFAELLLARDPAAKSRALETAYPALRDSDDDDYPHGLFLIGWSELRLRRDPQQAVALLESAYAEAAGRNLDTLAERARVNLAFARCYAGHFDQALASLSRDPAGPTSNMPDDWEQFDGGLEGFSRAYIHFWRGDLHASREIALAVAREGGADSSFVGLAHVYVALATTSLHDHASLGEARELLSRVSDINKHGVPWPAYKRVALARILALDGDIARARRVADPLLNVTGIPVSHALLAEFYRSIGQFSSAHLALQNITATECPSYARALAYTTLAVLDVHQKRPADARTHLERALDLSTEAGTLYPFLADDPGLQALLTEHATSGTRHEQRITRVFELRSHLSPRPELTQREREILSYLRTSMTAQEIADALHVSLTTVRTHTRAIYRKLGVTTRRDAIRTMIFPR